MENPPKALRVLMDAGWMQMYAFALAAGIVGTGFAVGEYFKVETAVYQLVTHIVLTVVVLYWLRTSGTKTQGHRPGFGPAVQARRDTNQYWHSCLWALIQHTDYFIIFMCRNMWSDSNPENAEPLRAMENEIATLNAMFLRPLGFTQDNLSLTQEFSKIMQDWSSNTGSTTFFDNGKLLFWFQIYEGTIHGMIIVGSLLHLLKAKGKWVETAIFWLYEMGMVLELITYGPSYFMTITVMLVGAFFPALLGIHSVVPGASAQALAVVFCTHHHVGYCLDTWGTFQICQAWGLTPSYAAVPDTSKTKTSSKVN